MEDERPLRRLHAAFARVPRRMPKPFFYEQSRQPRRYLEVERVRNQGLGRNHPICEALLARRARERPHAECGEAAEVPGHGAAGEALNLRVAPELVSKLEEHVCRFLV